MSTWLRPFHHNIKQVRGRPYQKKNGKDKIYDKYGFMGTSLLGDIHKR